MPRRADLRKFYSLMRRLERNIGGRFKLGECNAEIDLLQRKGVYFFSKMARGDRAAEMATVSSEWDLTR